MTYRTQDLAGFEFDERGFVYLKASKRYYDPEILCMNSYIEPAWFCRSSVETVEVEVAWSWDSNAQFWIDAYGNSISGLADNDKAFGSPFGRANADTIIDACNEALLENNIRFNRQPPPDIQGVLEHLVLVAWELVA